MFYYLNPKYNIWWKSFCSNPFCLKFRKALGPLGKTKRPNINTANSTKTFSIIDTIYGHGQH